VRRTHLLLPLAIHLDGTSLYFAGPSPMLLASLLLLTLGLGQQPAAATAAAAAGQLKCLGFDAPDPNATHWRFTATIPSKHMKDIFPPEEFSSILTKLVEGLELSVLTVQR